MAEHRKEERRSLIVSADHESQRSYADTAINQRSSADTTIVNQQSNQDTVINSFEELLRKCEENTTPYLFDVTVNKRECKNKKNKKVKVNDCECKILVTDCLVNTCNKHDKSTDRERKILVTDCLVNKHDKSKIEWIALHNTSEENENEPSDIRSYTVKTFEINGNNFNDVFKNLRFNRKIFTASESVIANFKLNQQISYLRSGKFHEIKKDVNPSLHTILGTKKSSNVCTYGKEQCSTRCKRISMMYIVFMAFLVSFAGWLVRYSYVKIIVATLVFHEANIGVPSICTERIGENAIQEARHAIGWARQVSYISNLPKAEVIIRNISYQLDNTEVCKVAKKLSCNAVLKTCVFAVLVSTGLEIVGIYGRSIITMRPTSRLVFVNGDILVSLFSNLISVTLGGFAQALSSFAPAVSFWVVSFVSSICFRYIFSCCPNVKCKFPTADSDYKWYNKINICYGIIFLVIFGLIIGTSIYALSEFSFNPEDILFCR